MTDSVLILDGAYSATRDGRIIRVRPAKGATVGHAIKQSLDRNGYLHVVVSVGCRVSTMWVHRLIAEAFMGPAPSGFQVNHKNGNKLDNSVGNLEYVLPPENIRHAYEHGLMHPKGAPGERNAAAKLTRDKVLEARRLRAEEGLTYEEIGKRFGVTKSTMHKACLGLNWRDVA